MAASDKTGKGDLCVMGAGDGWSALLLSVLKIKYVIICSGYYTEYSWMGDRPNDGRFGSG